MAGDPQGSVIAGCGEWMGGRGGHSPKGSSGLQTWRQGDNSRGGTSEKCMPDSGYQLGGLIPDCGGSVCPGRIPQCLSWFRHGLVNHSANGIYARVPGERHFHAMPLTLSLKAVEALMPVTEDKLPANGANAG